MNTYCNLAPMEPKFLSAKAGQPRLILVVDDDSGIRDILAAVLGNAGFDTSCAHDGVEGWEIFCRAPVDLVITDHEMPRLNGLGLLRLVREVRPEMPVIMMSGTMPSLEPDFDELLQPGAALAKPFSIKTLLSSMHGILPAEAPVAARAYQMNGR